MSQFARLKKAELQLLAAELSLSTDGLRSDLDARVSDFVDKEGGLQALVDNGTVSDKKVLALLGLTPSVAKEDKAETPAPLAKRSASKNAEADVEHTLVMHSPTKLVEFIQQHKKASWFRILTDLRAKLSTPESLVLVLIYLEFFALLWSRISFASEPALMVPVPSVIAQICCWFTKMFVTLPTGGYALPVYAPNFAGLLERRACWYPIFYWFEIFVALPSLLGWLINFPAAQTNKDKHVCPVSMLTFSLSRLMLFYAYIKVVDVNALFTGAPVTLSHKYLTVLFDGAHLPLKLFINTCIVGIVYSFRQKN